MIFAKEPILSTGQLINLVKSLASPAPQELDYFIAGISRREVASGELIVKANDICSEIYFVEKGLLRTYLEVDEKQVNTEFFFEGEFAGAFASFSVSNATSLHIEAIENSFLWVITKSVLDKMYELWPRWLALGKYLYEKEFIKKCQRESSFLKENAKQRYLKLLDQYPRLEERVSLRHIASYLGVQPETLSRIRSGKM